VHNCVDAARYGVLFMLLKPNYKKYTIG